MTHWEPFRCGSDGTRRFWLPRHPCIFVRAASRDGSRSGGGAEMSASGLNNISLGQPNRRADEPHTPQTFVEPWGGFEVALGGLSGLSRFRSWMLGVGCSVFTISNMHTTPLSRRSRGGLGAPWHRDGTVLYPQNTPKTPFVIR